MKKIIRLIPLLLSGFMLCIISAKVFSANWQEPEVAPPGSNIVPPINTGGVAQTKSGGLTIEGADGLTVGSAGWAKLSLKQSKNDTTNPFSGTNSAGVNLFSSTSDQAHFHFNLDSSAKPLLELASDLWVNGGDANVVADGYVQGKKGICVGSICHSSWATENQCGAGEFATGIDTNGKLTCKSMAAVEYPPTVYTVSTDYGSPRDIAIGTDGLAIIVYESGEICHCDNVQCTSATCSNLGAGIYPQSLGIGADDLPIITYGTHCITSGSKTTCNITESDYRFNMSHLSLGVCHCSNKQCSSRQCNTRIAMSSVYGGYPSLNSSIISSGLPLIAVTRVDYVGPNSLYICKCSDNACSSVSCGAVDQFLSTNCNESKICSAGIPDIAMGKDGLPSIVYRQYDGDKERFCHCNDQYCSAATCKNMPYGEIGLDCGITLIRSWKDNYPMLALGGAICSCNDDLCSSPQCATVDHTSSLAITNDLPFLTTSSVRISSTQNGSDVFESPTEFCRCYNSSCGLVLCANSDELKPSYTGRLYENLVVIDIFVPAIVVTAGSDGFPIIAQAGRIVHCNTFDCIRH